MRSALLALVALVSCGRDEETVRPQVNPHGWRALALAAHPELAPVLAADVPPMGSYALGLAVLDILPVGNGAWELHLRDPRLAREQRTLAVAHEGVLLAVEPLELFSDEAVQALYPVHAGGRELLVPDTHLARLAGHDAEHWANDQLGFVRELPSEFAEVPGVDGEAEPVERERR